MIYMPSHYYVSTEFTVCICLFLTDQRVLFDLIISDLKSRFVAQYYAELSYSKKSQLGHFPSPRVCVDSLVSAHSLKKTCRLNGDVM